MNATRQTENLEKVYEMMDQLKMLMRSNRQKRNNIMKQVDKLTMLSNRSPVEVSKKSIEDELALLEKQGSEIKTLNGSDGGVDKSTENETEITSLEPQHSYLPGDILPVNVINILLQKYIDSLSPETVQLVSEMQGSISIDNMSYDKLQSLKIQNRLLKEVFALLQNDNITLIDFLRNSFETDINEKLIKKLRESIYVNNINFLKFFQTQYRDIIGMELQTLNFYIQGLTGYTELLKVSEDLRNLYRLVLDHHLKVSHSQKEDEEVFV